MGHREPIVESNPSTPHERAASTFVERVRGEFGDAVVKTIVFGSTARGDADGLSSDVDVMVVLDEGAPFDRTAEALRDVAYDVMLEHGPVVELHVLSEREFKRSLADEQPFVRNVTSEGIAYG